MLREVRVPLPPAAAATARPPRRWLRKAIAGLPRLVEDAVIYGFLAALWGNSVGGTFLEVLGRWVFGEGSSVEAAGLAVAACCRLVMVRLLPASIPLVLMRVGERAKFDRAKEEEERKAEEEKEKPASNCIITVASAKEQLPKRNRAQPQLPKGVKIAPLYAFVPLFKLMCLGIVMKHNHDEGSLMWRVGYVLFDVAHLGIAIIVCFWAVRNVVILVTIPSDG